MDRELAQKYIARKRRNKRVLILSSICTICLTVFILVAFALMKVDRFTISTVESPTLSLTIDEARKNTTTELAAPPLLQATDTQYYDIPEDIDEGLGSKNTKTYFAYTFLLLANEARNEPINYSLSMKLNGASNQLEDAIRVLIIKDGKRKIYATTEKPIYYDPNHNEDTKELVGQTESFWNVEENHIALEWYKIDPGSSSRYTIVIWIDGWESVDSMKAGTFSADIKFSTENRIN